MFVISFQMKSKVTLPKQQITFPHVVFRNLLEQVLLSKERFSFPDIVFKCTNQIKRRTKDFLLTFMNSEGFASVV